MSLLEGHADVVMDGVGPEVIPSVEVIRKKFNQRRKGAGTLRPRAAPAARPRRQDGAVPRRRRVRARGRRQGRHGGLQRRLGGAREPAHARTRSATRAPGSAACTADLDTPWRSTRPSPRSGSPYDGSWRTSASTRCWSPAPGERTRSRCSPPPSSRPGTGRLARRRRDRRPRAAGGLGRARRPGGRADGRPGGRTRRSRPGRASTRRAGPRGGGPRGALRRPGGGRGARSAPGSCCSGTPWTTRPRRCCSG